MKYNKKDELILILIFAFLKVHVSFYRFDFSKISAFFRCFSRALVKTLGQDVDLRRISLRFKVRQFATYNLLGKDARLSLT